MEIDASALPSAKNGVLIYSGERYVPVFMGEWDSTKKYDALSIVTSGGNSYTSSRPVPSGTALTNTTYWSMTGSFNDQVADLTSRISTIENKLSSRDVSLYVRPLTGSATTVDIGNASLANSVSLDKELYAETSNSYYIGCYLHGSGYSIVAASSSPVSNLRILANQLSSSKGAASSNSSGTSTDIDFLFNHIVTTGTSDDSAGITAGTPRSVIAGNYIYKSSKTGHSGIRSTGERNIVTANTITGFAASIEVTGSNTIVSDIQASDTEVAVYQTDGSASFTLSNSTFTGITKYGLYLTGTSTGSKMNISNCVFELTDDATGLCSDHLESEYNLHMSNCSITNARNIPGGTYIDCSFKWDSSTSVPLVVCGDSKFIGCRFDGYSTLSLGVANSSHIYRTDFTDCIFINLGSSQAFSRSAGCTVYPVITNCTADSTSQIYAGFGSATTDDYQIHTGAIVNGVYLSYNLSQGSDIIAQESFKTLVPSGSRVPTYDTYTKLSGEYTGNTWYPMLPITTGTAEPASTGTPYTIYFRVGDPV